MAQSKRALSAKSSSPVQEWTVLQVSEWMKKVNGGHFCQYADKCASHEIDGAALIELTPDDMKTKLDISIPNHTTTLCAAIERLQKKSSRRKGKSPPRNRRDSDKTKSKSGTPLSPS